MEVLASIAWVVFFVLCKTDANVKDFPYTIGTRDGKVDGYVMEDVEVGDLVRLVEDVRGETYLRVHIVRSQIYQNISLIPIGNGIHYEAGDTTRFRVNNGGYIVVSNKTDIHESKYEFFVVLVNDTNSDRVSNPVALIVEIRSLPLELNQPAIILAGSLLAFIVLASLLIPFVVRTKRRLKQGKPVFAVGRSPSIEEQNKKNDTPRSSMSTDVEPKWFGRDMAYNYQDELALDANNFTCDILSIAKNKEHENMPSHQQVHHNHGFTWLDPHYEAKHSRQACRPETIDTIRF